MSGALSKLRPLQPLMMAQIKSNRIENIVRSMSEHRIFPLQPSRWQWTKFKDLMNFYILLGVIPLTLITGYVNVFVGPATLSEIPEAYVPKYWEYYKHPVSRFIARYILADPQQDYEKHLHFIFEESERIRMREIERKVKDLIAERKDYQAYYYRPVLAKYHRVSKEVGEYLESLK